MRTTQLIKEALVASILVIAVDLLISFFPLKFELIRPIKQGFNDFDIYDLRFAGNDTVVGTMDTSITVLCIAGDRKAIAEQVNTVAAAHPAVIGLDALFPERMDPVGDSALTAAIRHAGNIVVAAQYAGRRTTGGDEGRGAGGDAGRRAGGGDSIVRSYFSREIPGLRDGLWNFLEGPEQVNRHCIPFFKNDTGRYPSFAAGIVGFVNPTRYGKLHDRGNDIETINYQGNARHYNVITLDRYDSYLKTGGFGDLFRGKIVLIGFIEDREPYLLEDFHFTPMNSKPTGKSFPDMYGIVIHANIIEMALNGGFIDDMSGRMSYLVTFLLAFGINVFYIRLMSRRPGHHHVLLFLLQFVIAIVLIYLALLIFTWWNYKIDLMPMVIAMVLSFEIFWLYEWTALKLKKIFGYETFLGT